jgi:beta-glucosidase
MTLTQEDDLLHGVGTYQGPDGSIGTTTPIPSLKIPALTQEDGPAGIGDQTLGSTQLPAPEALAATFDPVAAACYGQVIGSEARTKGVDMVYGPTVNIVREPEWGRAFESLGEDPDLVGTIGAAEVEGIQRTGTMAQVKHYAVYTQETNRLVPADDAVLSAKALHEIYLRPFSQIVDTADPASIMCAYGVVGGVGNCEDRSLIAGYLDTTLHFTGFVGSDYRATTSTAGALAAGLDQEQPDSAYFGSALVAAVEAGQVPRAEVDQAALAVLTQMARFHLLTNPPSGTVRTAASTPADVSVAEQVAEEGTTLLKDGAGTLPLASSGRGAVAVIGPAASSTAVTDGGGSASVLAAHPVTPVEGIRAAVGGRRPVTDTAGLPSLGDLRPVPASDLAQPAGGAAGATAVTLTAPETGTYELGFSDPPSYIPFTLAVDGTPVVVNASTPPRPLSVGSVNLVAGHTYTVTGPVDRLVWATPSVIEADLAQAVAAARRASVAVVVVADGQESEAADRTSLALPGDQDALVEAVAKANPHTVVVIDAGAPVTMPWLAEVPAVLDAWYPGEAGGTALAAVLFGRVDPSGHLPVTFPRSATDDPVGTVGQFPGEDGTVRFTEGVDVGYRGFEASGRAPLFPFGFGLSYTRFSYASAQVHVATHHGVPVVSASVVVTNTGRRAGADVAQLYVGEPKNADEPNRQLEGFARVSLDPGQSRRVRFTLTGAQLAYYATGRHRLEIASGRYRVWMGDCSALSGLPVSVTFALDHQSAVPPT